MNVATTLIYFPMLLLSGATVPVEIFPDALQAVAHVLPLGVGIELLKSVSMGWYGGMAAPAAVLTAIAVVCSAIAIKTFRWE